MRRQTNTINYGKDLPLAQELNLIYNPKYYNHNITVKLICN